MIYLTKKHVCLTWQVPRSQWSQSLGEGGAVLQRCCPGDGGVEGGFMVSRGIPVSPINGLFCGGKNMKKHHMN